MKRYLTETEQRRLLAAAKACADPRAQRDYWWMRLMLLTGMRVHEFSLLTADQAEHALATGWLVVPASQRKGGKLGQEYCVTTGVREALQALLRFQRQDDMFGGERETPAPLVWGRCGEGLSVRSYQARIKEWAQAAGLDARISPHWLRHTRGVNIIKRSRHANPLKVAQQALGHATIASTGIYTQMLREDYVRDLHAVDGARMSRKAARQLAAQLSAGAAR